MNLQKKDITKTVINELEKNVANELKNYVSPSDLEKATNNVMHRIILFKLHYPTLDNTILSQEYEKYYNKSDNNIERIP